MGWGGGDEGGEWQQCRTATEGQRAAQRVVVT